MFDIFGNPYVPISITAAASAALASPSGPSGPLGAVGADQSGRR